MKNLKTLLAALVVLASPAALADQILLGKLVSPAGATVNNTTTAVPFSLPNGAKVDIQCSAAARFATGQTSAVVATADSFRGISDSTKDTYPLDPRRGFKFVAMIPVTAAATTCWVYEVVTQ